MAPVIESFSDTVQSSGLVSYGTSKFNAPNVTVLPPVPGLPAIQLTQPDFTMIEYQRAAQMMSFSAQFGGCLVVTVLYGLLTPRGRRRVLVYRANLVAVLLAAARNLCTAASLLTAIGSVWVTATKDTRALGSGARAWLLITDLASLATVIVIELSLMAQTKMLTVTVHGRRKMALLAAGGLVVVVEIAMRFTVLITSLIYDFTGRPVLHADPLPLVETGFMAFNVLFFACVFVVTLLRAIRTRRLLGLTGFGATQVIFVMSCQTMVLPALCSILQFAFPSSLINSLNTTLVAISLPLTSLWATSVNRDQPYSSFSSVAMQPLAIETASESAYDGGLASRSDTVTSPDSRSGSRVSPFCLNKSGRSRNPLGTRKKEVTKDIITNGPHDPAGINNPFHPSGASPSTTTITVLPTSAASAFGPGRYAHRIKVGEGPYDRRNERAERHLWISDIDQLPVRTGWAAELLGESESDDGIFGADGVYGRARETGNGHCEMGVIRPDILPGNSLDFASRCRCSQEQFRRQIRRRFSDGNDSLLTLAGMPPPPELDLGPTDGEGEGDVGHTKGTQTGGTRPDIDGGRTGTPTGLFIDHLDQGLPTTRPHSRSRHNAAFGDSDNGARLRRQCSAHSDLGAASGRGRDRICTRTLSRSRSRSMAERLGGIQVKHGVIVSSEKTGPK